MLQQKLKELDRNYYDKLSAKNPDILNAYNPATATALPGDFHVASDTEINEVMEKATKEKHACLVYKANEEKVQDMYLSFKCPGNDPKFKLKF